jgi:hypothetical protein
MSRLSPLALLLAAACTAAPEDRLLDPDPDAVRRVWMFTSLDGESWGSRQQPVAWNLESLGLAVDPDSGDLLVTGVVHHRLEPPPWERYTGPPVRGLRFDGVTWSPLRLRGQDADALAYIDPQLFEDELWYVATDSSDGDPIKQEATLTLRSAPPATVRFAAAGIADPSPVRVDGALHVFATTRRRGAVFEVLHLAGEPLEVMARYPDVAVPFARLDAAGDVVLLVQKQLHSKRQPVRVTLPAAELGQRSQQPRSPRWEPLLSRAQLDPLQSCTSPVVGPNPAGGLVLLCVEELDSRLVHPKAGPPPAR